MANNKESMLKLFMMDLVKASKIDFEGEPNSEFWKRWVKLTQVKWKTVDDYYVYKSLASVFEGLTHMVWLAENNGIIKNPLKS